MFATTKQLGAVTRDCGADEATSAKGVTQHSKSNHAPRVVRTSTGHLRRTSTTFIAGREPVHGLYSPCGINDKAEQLQVAYLPLYSQHVTVIERHDAAYFDKYSQRVLSESVRRQFLNIFVAAGRHLLKLLLKVKFDQWRFCINRNYPSRWQLLRYRPKLPGDNVTLLWCYRKGLQLIVGYYWEMYHNQLRRRFRQWKLYTQEMRRLLIHFFDKWNVKAARIRLNRMKARRFLKLLQPLARRLYLMYLRRQWRWFLQQCELMKIWIWVRLLFRCWRTVVVALRKARRKAMERAMYGWCLGLRRQKLAEEQLQQRYQGWLQRRILLRSCARWWTQLQQRLLLLRVLLRMTRKLLNRAWRKWLMHLRMPLPVRIDSPPESPRVEDSHRCGHRFCQLVCLVRRPRVPKRTAIRRPPVPPPELSRQSSSQLPRRRSDRTRSTSEAQTPSSVAAKRGSEIEKMKSQERMNAMLQSVQRRLGDLKKVEAGILRRHNERERNINMMIDEQCHSPLRSFELDHSISASHSRISSDRAMQTASQQSSKKQQKPLSFSGTVKGKRVDERRRQAAWGSFEEKLRQRTHEYSVLNDSTDDLQQLRCCPVIADSQGTFATSVNVHVANLVQDQGNVVQSSKFPDTVKDESVDLIEQNDVQPKVVQFEAVPSSTATELFYEDTQIIEKSSEDIMNEATDDIDHDQNDKVDDTAQQLLQQEQQQQQILQSEIGSNQSQRQQQKFKERPPQRMQSREQKEEKGDRTSGKYRAANRKPPVPRAAKNQSSSSLKVNGTKRNNGSFSQGVAYTARQHEVMTHLPSRRAAINEHRSKLAEVSRMSRMEKIRYQLQRLHEVDDEFVGREQLRTMERENTLLTGDYRDPHRRKEDPESVLDEILEDVERDANKQQEEDLIDYSHLSFRELLSMDYRGGGKNKKKSKRYAQGVEDSRNDSIRCSMENANTPRTRDISQSDVQYVETKGGVEANDQNFSQATSSCAAQEDAVVVEPTEPGNDEVNEAHPSAETAGGGVEEEENNEYNMLDFEEETES